MAGIYKSAVSVAPKTPILIAHASGLKKILANIKGTNPPSVVSDVVITVSYTHLTLPTICSV